MLEKYTALYYYNTKIAITFIFRTAKICNVSDILLAPLYSE